MIPLGSYVKMVDSRVDEVPEHEKHLAFDQSHFGSASIVAAGPILFLFAIVAYWLVFLIGVPAVKPVIGEVTFNYCKQELIRDGTKIHLRYRLRTGNQSTWDSFSYR